MLTLNDVDRNNGSRLIVVDSTRVNAGVANRRSRNEKPADGIDTSPLGPHADSSPLGVVIQREFPVSPVEDEVFVVGLVYQAHQTDQSAALENRLTRTDVPVVHDRHGRTLDLKSNEDADRGMRVDLALVATIVLQRHVRDFQCPVARIAVVDAETTVTAVRCRSHRKKLDAVVSVPQPRNRTIAKLAHRTRETGCGTE